jgi:hypothetical protein
MHSTQRNLLGEIALGAVAGAAATWLMGKATTWLYEQESEPARQREDQARNGRTAYETAAEKFAGLAFQELSDDERKKLGSAIHWSIGIGSSVLYALLRRRLAGQGLGKELAAGAVFGTAVWLLLDEVGNVALGLTPGPTVFPWQTHARGLAGHLVLGLAAEGVLQAADVAVARAA